ncbi:MAG: YbaN family protein [Fusobacteriaceae bacterium]
MNIKKIFFFIIAILSLILGVIGIFLPVLPTTPFLLLTALLLERSSPKFHKILLQNKVVGKYLSDYIEKKGITLKNKIISLIFLTLGMGKGFLSMSTPYGRGGLVIIFIAVSFHILKIKTLKGEVKNV